MARDQQAAKQAAEQAIAAVIRNFEIETGLGVVAVKLRADCVFAHLIDARPHEARSLGVELPANEHGIDFSGDGNEEVDELRRLLAGVTNQTERMAIALERFGIRGRYPLVWLEARP